MNKNVWSHNGNISDKIQSTYNDYSMLHSRTICIWQKQNLNLGKWREKNLSILIIIVNDRFTRCQSNTEAYRFSISILNFVLTYTGDFKMFSDSKVWWTRLSSQSFTIFGGEGWWRKRLRRGSQDNRLYNSMKTTIETLK